MFVNVKKTIQTGDRQRQQVKHGFFGANYSDKFGMVSEEDQSEAAAQRCPPGHGGDPQANTRIIAVCHGPLSRTK